MRQPDDDALLADILIAAREAHDIASGTTKEHFDNDRVRQLALVKLIEVVGEAASKLSEAARTSIPEVPWNAIIGMRHRLVHDYGEIDYEIVWDVATSRLQVLVSAIEPRVPPQHDS